MARRQVESRTPIPYPTRRRIFDESGHVCAHCGCELDFNKNFTVEHVIPLFKGGTSDVKNLVALCRTCNKAKSDKIYRPQSYYKYVNKTRMAELSEMFDEYLARTDWLAYDNLFRTDSETQTVLIEQRLRNGKSARIPMTIAIRKIGHEYAFEWLQLYTARLRTEDKHVMAGSVDDLKSPYYVITCNDRILMLCSAYTTPTEFIPERDTNLRAVINSIRIETFTNPNVKYKPDLTPRLLYGALTAVMTRIQETLNANTDEESLIQCLVEYPASDPYADLMFEYVREMWPKQWNVSRTSIDDTYEPSIHSYMTFFYQGGTQHKTLSEIDPRLGEDSSTKDFIEAIIELQQPLERRLESAKHIRGITDKLGDTGVKERNPDLEPPPPPKKINRKQLHRRNHKRRKRPK